MGRLRFLGDGGRLDGHCSAPNKKRGMRWPNDAAHPGLTSSYLVVRGVEWTRLMPFVLAPMPFLIAALALFNSGVVDLTFPFDLGEYSVFASATAALCVGVLLTHQANVSDHVLWMGALVIVVLLTPLIPADDEATTRCCWFLKAPFGWGWVLSPCCVPRPAWPAWRFLHPMRGCWCSPPISTTTGERRPCSHRAQRGRLGNLDAGVGRPTSRREPANGRSQSQFSRWVFWVFGNELAASGLELLNLWNLGFMLACVAFVATTRPDGMTALGVLAGMGSLLLAHAFLMWSGRHQGQPQSLVVAWSIGALALTWQYGMEAGWATALTAGSVLLVLEAVDRANEEAQGGDHDATHRSLPGRLLTLHLGMMTALFLIVALGPQRTTLLTGQDTLMSVEMNMHILLAMGVASLVLYMQRLRAVDALLPPTTAAIALLISMALAGQTVEMPSVQTTALVMFVLVGAYLAFKAMSARV